ncbi:MAG: PAS domain S-box protein [Planctomycetaceae bacterium]|nr:PAS domain S-box protein [Planctomycetaceae bacterium]
MKTLNEELEQRVSENSQQNQLFATTVSNSGEGVFITLNHQEWADSQTIFVNHAILENTGLTEAELIGKTPRLFLNELFDSGRLEKIQSDLDSQGSSLIQVAIDRKDGTSLETEINVITLFDETDKRTHYVTILRDISSQKQSELALRGSEERFRVLFEKSLDAILVTNDTGHFLMANDAACKLLGYPRKKLLTMQVSDITSQPSSNAQQRYEEYLKSGQEVGEFRFIAPGGEGRIAEYAAVKIGPDRHLSILRDVTQRRNVENALKKSEEQIRTILNTASDAIITIDIQGIINGVNPATEEMFGYSEDEMIGQNVKMLMPPPYCDEHDAYLKRYLETGEARIIGIGREVEGIRKDGSTFPADLSVSVVDHLELFTGIIRDITERRSIQERLIQSERLSALGEAMTGLAHESRNALSRSNANLNQLRRRLKGKEEFLGFIERALQANSDIQRQFEEVREFASPIKPRKKSIDLPLIINRAWEELTDERFVSMTNLTISQSNFTGKLEADPELLRDVFRNLMENSVAACDGKCEITVTLSETMEHSTPLIQISFSDNGPGMSSDSMKRAFDSFFTTKTRGTGLGLAIVKRIIEAHGGKVRLGESEKQGTEIIIVLPLR